MAVSWRRNRRFCKRKVGGANVERHSPTQTFSRTYAIHGAAFPPTRPSPLPRLKRPLLPHHPHDRLDLALRV